MAGDPDEGEYRPRHRSGPATLPGALAARFGPFGFAAALAAALTSGPLEEPPPAAAWVWCVPAALVVGLLLGWAYVAATAAGGRAAGVAWWLAGWLGIGVVFAWFGLRGEFYEWGALFGWSFVTALVAGSVLVLLHRRGRLELPRRRRRPERTGSLYGPDDAG